MKLIGKILVALLVVMLAGFGYWRYDHLDREHQVTPEALAALESDDSVTITQGEWIEFRPSNGSPTKGLVFYPGGECDERGYAEPLREIAARGYLVVLAPMPFQLAVLDIEAANGIIEAHPEIETWGIAGHSLGGSMAARYAFQHPDNVSALIMWDAYPPDDMSNSDILVSMVHRANQAGDTPPDYEPHLASLPEQTVFYPLKGGNHLNFGNFIAGRIYRDEPAAELDAAQQRSLAASATSDILAAM